MPLPRFQLRDIPDEGLTVDTALDATTLRAMLDGSEYAPGGDPSGKVTVRIDTLERDVILVGTVDASLRGTCVRCLEPVDVATHADFSLHLRPANAVSAHGVRDEVELAPEELDEDQYDGEVVELDRWVREQILLEAPQFPQCAGECAAPIQLPAIEAEPAHAVDPRLAPLQKFSKKR